MISEQSRDRALAYYNIDGLGELSISFMMLSCAALMWLEMRAPEKSLWNAWYTFVLYFGGMISIMHYGTKAIKQRLTFPRTGFVEYRKQDAPGWLMRIGAFCISGIVAGLMTLGSRNHWNLGTPASLVGLFFAASYGYGIARRSAPWKWAVAVLLAVGSVALALLPAATIGRMAEGSWLVRIYSPQVVGALIFSFAIYGTLLLVSGGITLWQYLEEHL